MLFSLMDDIFCGWEVYRSVMNLGIVLQIWKFEFYLVGCHIWVSMMMLSFEVWQ